MKRWLLHIWMMGVLGMLAASCSQDADDPTVDSRSEKEKVMIRFTIALDEPKAASRSWDGYDPDDTGYNGGPQSEDDTEYMLIGSDYENFIDPSTVQVLVYDMNGTLMGKLQDVTVNPLENNTTEDTQDPHIYDLTGSFEADADQVSSLDFKLMVFANTASMTNLNNTASLEFSNPLASGKGIPMWGIATYENVNLSTSTSVGTAAEIGNIYMLRSMAKIEVSLSSETSTAGYSLTGATLNKTMKNGIVMPKLRKANATTDVTISGLASTKELGIDEVFNPVAVTNDNVDTGTFTEVVDENNQGTGTYIIYIPEYDVVNGALDIALGLKKGSNDIPSKSFAHGGYASGAYTNTPWSVVRNHYYKYEVTIKDGNQLALTCQVQPWTLDQEILDYETFVSVSQVVTPIVGTIYDNAVVMVDKTVSENYKVKMAQVEFTILTPQGYTWYASLIADDEGKAFGFAELDEDDNLIVDSTTGKVATTAMASGKVGTKSTLTIVSEHTGLQNAISSRLQIVVRDDNTGHTYVVNDDVLTGSGSYYIVQNP